MGNRETPPIPIVREVGVTHNENPIMSALVSTPQPERVYKGIASPLPKSRT